MGLAKTVEVCLERHYLPYAVVFHSHATSSADAASAAAVRPDQIAKAVILTDANGLVMAVVPGDSHVGLDALAKLLARDLSPVAEARLVELFPDCAPGAIPPLGPAYGIETVVDERVLAHEQVYFVGGDHDALVRVELDTFLQLLGEAKLGRISCLVH